MVNSRDNNLPDVLPRQEPRRSNIQQNGKEKRCSPGVLRPDSCSNISVLSTPSEFSIEEISIKIEQELTQLKVLNQVDLVITVQV